MNHEVEQYPGELQQLRELSQAVKMLFSCFNKVNRCQIQLLTASQIVCGVIPDDFYRGQIYGDNAGP